MKRFPMLLAAALGLVLAAGCSDDDGDYNNTQVKPDMDVSDFTTPAWADGAEACGKDTYPCGPYGTGEGDVVENMAFTGYFDAKHLCKKAHEEVMDTGTLRTLSFKDIYQGDKSCPSHKPKVLWVMISAGWCGPCQYEVKTIQGWYKTANQVHDKIALLNILYEDTKSMPAHDTFIKSWISAYNLSLPVLMDPSFRLGKFFSRKAVPFNMLIDLTTMKVHHRKAGADLTGIGQKAVALASSL